MRHSSYPTGSGLRGFLLTILFGLGLVGGALAQAQQAASPNTTQVSPPAELSVGDDVEATMRGSSMLGLSASESAQFLRLSQNLRCLTCSNTSLESSQTAFAIEARATLRKLVEQHLTDDAIYAAMTQTYGDAIRYSPPLNPKTVLLWLGPVLLALILAIAIWRGAVRREISPLGRHPRLEEALRVIRGEA